MNPIDQLREYVDIHCFEKVRADAQAIWLHSSDLAALVLFALASARLGEREELDHLLKELEPHVSGFDADALVDYAALLILLGQSAEAFTILESVLRQQPEHALAMARTAFIHTQNDELAKAVELYETSLALDAERVGVWLALARVHLQTRAFNEAQLALDSAALAFDRKLSSSPHLRDALGDLGIEQQIRRLQLKLWVQLQQFAKADDWLETQRQAVGSPTHSDEPGASLVSVDEGRLTERWLPYVQVYVQGLIESDLHAQAESVLADSQNYLPESIELLQQRANLAKLHGRTTQALAFLRRAISLAKVKENPAAVELSLQVQLAEACSFGLVEAKRAAAERAQALSEELVESDTLTAEAAEALRLSAECVLASVELDQGNYEQAETLCQNVLASNAHYLRALRVLGELSLQQGKIESAVAYFERVQALDPVQGVSALINTRKIPEDPAILTRLESIALQPSAEGSARSGLLFSLASAWEKHKEYDKAFDLVVRANAVSRKHLKYSPAEHRQACARIRYAFGRELYAHRESCGYRDVNSSLPVFVVGMPRSGTTLVEQILAGHSEIFGAGELSLITERVQGLNRWERHLGSARAYPDCVDDMSPEFTHALAKSLLDELQALAVDEKPNAKHVVDKLPHNFENIGLIKFIFPEAKIISVRRDPRDIAISNYFTDFAAKHGGMGFAYDLEWIGEQLADHNLLMHHWHQVFPGEILEVQYEDVVEDTEGMARKMLDYIGVEWEPQVLAFNELDRPVKTASVWQVRQPIYKTSKAKWGRYQDHLAPLIKGTNAKITWDPIDMVTLPEPGWLTEGVRQYKADDLDGAEYTFKKLLHHLPEHAAANHMVGIIYARKGHVKEAVELMEKALKICPWNQNWRKDLIQALELVGNTERADELKRLMPPAAAQVEVSQAQDDFEWGNLTLPNTNPIY